MHKEIIDLIKNGKKIHVQSIKKHYYSFYNDVNEYNSKNFRTAPFKQKVYNYINGIKGFPICENLECNNKVSFENKSYKRYCSLKCSSNSSEVKIKRKKTMLKKYGVEHNSLLDDYKVKYRETMLKRYGVEHPMYSDKIKNQIKQKNLEKYDCEYTIALDKTKDKIKQSFIDKYGVDNPFKSDKIKEQIKKTNLEKYGVDNPFKSNEVKEKIKRTNLEKYGVEHNTYSKEIQEKRKNTNFKKYGVECSLQSNEIKEKIRKTNLDRYGVEIPSQSKKVKEKIKKTISINRLNRYKEKLNHKDIFYVGDDNYLIKNYCDEHNEFTINANNILNRLKIGIPLCTKCNPISSLSSIKEKELKEYIISKFNDVNINDRKILDGKEIDIYIPKHNLGVEFNGLYYHSELFVDKNYHIQKTKLAESKNINLIHIFEDEWVYKKDIVKSIINSKLGYFDEIIFSNKCIIKEVSNEQSKLFLNINHVEGNIDSSIRIGLFHNNELVSMMCFGKKRKPLSNKSQNNIYEIHRFCNKLNTNVIDAAFKLFNFFIKTYNPNEVISYVDKRYFTGRIYEKLGFSFEKETKPNYWYCKGLKRYHSQEFKKNDLFTEHHKNNEIKKETMIKRNNYRIYDCGSKKFLYKN